MNRALRDRAWRPDLGAPLEQGFGTAFGLLNATLWRMTDRIELLLGDVLRLSAAERCCGCSVDRQLEDQRRELGGRCLHSEA